MNYIELIKQFWQCNNEIPIGCNATALYFYLLKVCNSLAWKETFKHSDRHIAMQLGISINTVRTAKNRLKQLGLIDFKSPEKSSKGLNGSTTYKIVTLSNFDTVADSVPDSVHDTVADSVPDTINKLNYIIYIDKDQFYIFDSLRSVYEEFLNDTAQLEILCMNNHITFEKIKLFIARYFAKLTNEGKKITFLEEVRQHFANWLRCELEKEQKSSQKGGNNEKSENGTTRKRYTVVR